ncbi:aspartyl/asparaginyl beta-hydroxylase [Blastomonas natatoria]|uniref:Aspartyl/asparaginyl beta-hydroxylase n=1 Tax=Blastomonas natatoria TaxID=34015 RepID=A0A2V3V5I8_9SPHN|nr:aspartyl/asparaginyl beta-hydroxylase domain-containing protein [Blastomonas natatoria]PXW70058.1 aspartyl/asparaginyl beta-hydroxylase [Blastomonas natatoria]
MERHLADTLVNQGREAMRRRDAATARLCFEQVVRDPPPGIAPPWLLLSQACQLAGDQRGQEQALAQLLERDPRHLAGLLLMGELKASLGDTRAATSFFMTGVTVADQSGAPDTIRPLVEKARNYLQQANGSYAEHLSRHLAERNIVPGQISARVDEALDLLLGRRQVFLQQPTSFYFPALPQRQFYEAREFDWAEGFEALAPAMVEELENLLDNRGQGFSPYLRTDPNRPAAANPLRDDPSWGAHFLWEDGSIVADHAALAPVTMEALATAPMPEIAERSPMALYSLLRPGTHIRPHHGMLNTRLICHLPLITNPDCAIRVGNETRRWQHGKLLIFDDSIEHEAWNRGSATRIILLFEIWRPEISQDERAALTTIFESIAAFGGMPRGQG